MNRKLIAAAAGVLLLGAGAAGLAQAQDRDGRGRGGVGGGGGAAREAPRAAPQRAAPRVERSQPRVERSQPRVERRAVERPQRERAQQVQRQRERKVERAQRSQRQQQQQVERKKRDQQQSAERQQRQDQQAVERRQREQQKQASPKQDARPEGKQAGSPERVGPQRVNRVQASDEQRKGVRDRIFRERSVDRIRGRDFRAKVAIGSHIDRRHRRHVHRLTPAILAFAPIYAGYSYLVVDDEICIVDPETYYVVDVIPSSVEYAAGPRPQLALSAEDMAFIYASVPKDRRVEVRVRLALGAEVPVSVDLERFPGGVIDRVPQLESYSYIVVEDDVVIVDLRDRAVALVITE
ncbi:MAG: hypothetical protein ABWY63_11735 [Hyphomicrobiaceae bacterium]